MLRITLLEVTKNSNRMSYQIVLPLGILTSHFDGNINSLNVAVDLGDIIIRSNQALLGST